MGTNTRRARRGSRRSGCGSGCRRRMSGNSRSKHPSLTLCSGLDSDRACRFCPPRARGKLYRRVRPARQCCAHASSCRQRHMTLSSHPIRSMLRVRSQRGSVRRCTPAMHQVVGTQRRHASRALLSRANDFVRHHRMIACMGSTCPSHLQSSRQGTPARHIAASPATLGIGSHRCWHV